MTDIGGSKFLTKGQVTLTSESKSWLDSPPTNQFCVQTTILNHVSNSFLRQRKFFFLFWCPRSCLDLGRMVLAFFFVFNKALHHIGHNKNNIWTPVLVYSVGWSGWLFWLVGCYIWLIAGQFCVKVLLKIFPRGQVLELYWNYIWLGNVIRG